MGSAKGTEKLEKFVKALDEMVELGEDIMEDGKIDFQDVMHLPKFAPVLEKLYGAWKDREEMFEEAKDLDWVEAAKLLSVVSA